MQHAPSAVTLDRSEFASHPPDCFAGPVTAVPVNLIDASDRNPRQDLRDINELARSIAQHGVLQPLLVRPNGERYQVIAGHRRLLAVQKLAWRAVPAVIRRADEDEAYLLLLAAQLHVLEWQPREQAQALERLLASGKTLKQIGQALGHTESWVSKRARTFADDVLGPLVQTHALAVGTAEELLRVRNIDQRRHLAERATAESWTQDTARAEVRRLHRPPSFAAIAAGRSFQQELRWLTPGEVDDAAAELFLSIGAELAQLLGARAGARAQMRAAVVGVWEAA